MFCGFDWIKEVSMEKRYQIKSSYILREIAGEYAIVPVDEESVISNAVMLPNETAVFLWKAFQEPCTMDEVVKKALCEYDAEEEIIQNAVARFMRETLTYKMMMEVE